MRQATEVSYSNTSDRILALAVMVGMQRWQVAPIAKASHVDRGERHGAR